MRNTTVPSMLKALEWNLNRSEFDVRLMEIGRLYHPGRGILSGTRCLGDGRGWHGAPRFVRGQRNTV